MIEKRNIIIKQTILLTIPMFFIFSNISAESLKQDIVASFQQKKSACVSQEDYNKLAEELYAFLKKNPDYEKSNYLHYLIAESRVDQLEELRKQDDLEAGRLYVKFNDKYYTEALEEIEIEECSAKSTDFELSLNAQCLKFVIFEKKQNIEQSQQSFQALVKMVDTLDDKSIRELKSEGLIKRLSQYDLDNFAQKISIYNILKNSENDNPQEAIQKIKVKADELFTNNDYSSAKALYGEFMDSALKYNDKNELLSSLQEIADKYFMIQDYNYARELYQKIVKEYSNSSNAPYAYFKFAESYVKQGDDNKAIAEYKELISKYPEDNWSGEAYYQIASCYFIHGKQEEAISALKDLIRKYPKSSLVSNAKYLIGITYYNQKQNALAKQEFQELLKDFPDYPKRKLVEKILAKL